MSFLNPALLAGLALFAVPLIIHLLNRQRHKKRPWAAMEFLLRAWQKTRNRLRNENLLLLLLRCLLVLLAALAMALPFVPSDSPLAALAGGRREVVYVLDRSGSMGRLVAPGVPLAERKRVLKSVVERYSLPNVHYSEHMDGNGAAFFRQACQSHLEGIICKRRDSTYQAGRSYDWLKVKCVQSGEFVIGGYSEPSGARTGLGALLVGYHNRKGDLLYAGKVGTGFSGATLELLRNELVALENDESPFSNWKRSIRGTHWVEPKLVAQVVFGSRTRDGRLRHASWPKSRAGKRQVSARGL